MLYYVYMSPESIPTPPDDFEKRLITGAREIDQWVKGRQQRGSHDGTTWRKIAPKLGALAEQFRNKAAYIQAPLFLLPYETGEEGIGSGEVTGEIVGFSYRDFTTLNERQDEGTTEQGVVAIVATEHTNNPEVTIKSWKHVLPEIIRLAIQESEDYSKKGVVPVLIPIVEGTHFTEIENSLPLFFNTSSMDSPETERQDFDYRKHVTKIEKLMQGRTSLSPGIDNPLASALNSEIKEINSRCPYLGKMVFVRANYMRTPSKITQGNFTILSGEEVGVLRKFIYAPYFPGVNQPDMQARGTVQAVIYPIEVAAAVYKGELLPQVADTMPGTIFLPLDQEHRLESLE